jgi:WD40 repeat protein
MDSAATPDVFISYSHEDRASAQRLAQWCAACGWSVWWDEAIVPGRKWDQAIERALADARCVLVLWSARSVRSDWVKTEAAEAARRGVLVPVLIEPIELPLEFRRVQTLDLTGAWDLSSAALDRLRGALAEHIGRPAADISPPPAPTPRWLGSRRAAAAAVLGVAVLGAAVVQWLPRVSPQAVPQGSTPAAASAAPAPASRSLAIESTRQPSAAPVAEPTSAAARPLPARPSASATTGADVARLADEQRQVLIDKASKSGEYWTGMLEKEGGALLLEQAVLLGVEAVRRGGADAADAALRRTLALMARPLRKLPHDGEVLRLAFSPDGRTMATTSEDWSAVLWDTASGRKNATLKHEDTVRDIAFSRDGRLVASGSGKTARLWQVSDGKELAILPHTSDVREVMFVSDRLMATVASRDNDVDVRLWTVPEGREALRIVPPKGMLDFVVSDDGSYLVGHMPPGTAEPALVWDLSSGKQAAALSAGGRGVVAAATHKDVLALGERQDGMVSLWRLGTWAPLGQVHGIRAVPRLALDPAAQRLVVAESGTAYGQILVAPVAAGRTRASALSARKNGGICCLALSADGRRAVASSADGMASVVDIGSGEELLRARLTEKGSLAAALSPDGRWLLTAAGASAQVWEVTVADPLRTACRRVNRSFTPEEWRHWFGNEPWRRTCEL